MDFNIYKYGSLMLGLQLLGPNGDFYIYNPKVNL